MREALGMADKRVVGTKQILRELQKQTLQTVFVAMDADDYIFRRVMSAAEDNHIPVIRVDTMKELGLLCKINVGTAAAGLFKPDHEAIG